MTMSPHIAPKRPERCRRYGFAGTLEHAGGRQCISFHGLTRIWLARARLHLGFGQQGSYGYPVTSNPARNRTRAAPAFAYWVQHAG